MVAKVLTSDAGRLELHVIMPAVRLNLSRSQGWLVYRRDWSHKHNIDKKETDFIDVICLFFLSPQEVSALCFV
jgi:hypothetical protein